MIIQSKAASEIAMFEKHLLVVVLPVEICLNEQRHLHIADHRWAVDTLEVRIIDVVDLDVILSVRVTIDTDLHSHRILTNVPVLVAICQ